MQNKCNCGCEQGFVPVNSNWDFNTNGDCGCQQNDSRRNRQQGYGCQPDFGRRNNSCGCDECEKNYSRARSNDDCQCERCNDNREVECCEQNTYVRNMDDCGHNGDCTRNRSACTGREDCPCENCARKRNRSYACEKDCACSGNREYNRGRSGDCGCGKVDENGGYNRYGKNRGVGMIKGFMQEIDEVFESESALRAGTLFPELHKPMNGYCPCDSNCGTCKQAAAFAAWELRLYLNTHPNDEEALKLFRKLCKEAEEPNYATSFLKDDCCTTGWGWVKNPWPWEFDCRCGD